MKRNYALTLASLPPEWGDSLLSSIRSNLETSNRKVVVLDDHPSGTQTVHQVDVYTKWSVPLLEEALQNEETSVHILTNTRGLPARQSRDIHREIGANLSTARESTGRDFSIISCSGATLRGHYPLEIDVLATALGGIDGILIIPAFFEGGWFTIDDMQYAVDDEDLIPIHETPLARDPEFGFRSSNLCAWVAEKNAGRWNASQVAALSLDDLRRGGPARVAEVLGSLSGERPCVINATCYRDLEILVVGLMEAEAAGKRFICRSAASFPRVRSGVIPRPLLQAADLPSQNNQQGGLILAGAIAKRTTAQLEAVRNLPNLAWMELSVPALLDTSARSGHIREAVTGTVEGLRAGMDVVLYTSRGLVKEHEGRGAQKIGSIITEALSRIVQRLDVPPAWMIAKGSTTSAVLASHGLNMRRARILGQALPGIPVWQAGNESRFPGLNYVVFPGSFGEPNDLAEMIDLLRQGSRFDS